MHNRYHVLVSHCALFAIVTLACTNTANPDAGTEATGFGINPAHDNAQPTDVVASPLQPAWIALLDGGTVSYPLVAGGRVIVAIQPPDSVGQSTVTALSLASGDSQWSVPFPGLVTIAYDNGNVFVLKADGFLFALDATDGNLLWTTQLAGELLCGAEAHYFNSPPTAVNSPAARLIETPDWG
jgi:outer membrane protein assembly factor BamB